MTEREGPPGPPRNGEVSRGPASTAPSRASWVKPAGELLLIVAGVLIALWIEDWRQERIDLATEIEYLSRLESDVDADIEDLERHIRHTEMRESNARAVLAFLDSAGQSGNLDLVQSLNRAGFISFFRHNRATWDDLLSTGNLALMKNKALVRDISDYYRSTDFLMAFDDAKKATVWGAYRGNLEKHVPTLLIAGGSETDGPEIEAIDWAAMKTDSAMETSLGSVIGVARVERRNLRRAHDAANALKAILAAEREARRS